MKPLRRRSKALARWARVGLVVAFTAVGGPGQAVAQVIFSPYPGYAFPQPNAESELGLSPRRVAAILARNGYRLAGPLGRRGDEIIAYGVDERGWRMRIIVDPYEGEILNSKPIGPAFAHGGPFDGATAAGPYESMGGIFSQEGRRRGGLAPLDPYGPAEEAEPGARSRPRAIIPDLGEEARPVRQSKALSAPHSRMAIHSRESAGRRAVRNSTLSKAAKSAVAHSAADAGGRVARPAPMRAIAPSPKAATTDELAHATAAAPTTKAATEVAPVLPAAPTSLAPTPRATKPEAADPPRTPAAQPNKLGPTNEAGIKSNISR
jgi:hypothetical protein